MASIRVDEAEFSALTGKVILITGCATGIGRATVDLAYGKSSWRCGLISSLAYD